MSTPLSIIVPVYKIEESYFRECLDSLVAIGNKDVEVVLVDDGSPDNCGAICDEYAKKDARVRVLHKENAGVSAARNDGIRMARGKYIMFVDADDWVDSSIIDECLSDLNNFSSTVIVYGYVMEKKTSRIIVQGDIKNGVYSTDGEIKELCINAIGFDCLRKRTNDSLLSFVCAKMYQRSFLTSNGLFFNEKLSYGEDTAFFAQLIQKADKVSVLKKSFYHYRNRESSACGTKRNGDFGEVYELFFSLNDICKDWDSKIIFEGALECLLLDNLSCRYSCKWAIGKSALGTFVEKTKAIHREYKKEPFKSAIKKVKYSNYRFKGKIKVFLFKIHLPELVLLMKWIKRKLKREKTY